MPPLFLLARWWWGGEEEGRGSPDSVFRSLRAPESERNAAKRNDRKGPRTELTSITSRVRETRSRTSPLSQSFPLPRSVPCPAQGYSRDGFNSINARTGKIWPGRARTRRAVYHRMGRNIAGDLRRRSFFFFFNFCRGVLDAAPAVVGGVSARNTLIRRRSDVAERRRSRDL